MKNVDNTINFPEEPQYLEYLPEPVTLTCKLLLKMKDVFKDCRYLLENEFATEKDKIKIITSKKIYHTYTCIKLLSKIHMENLSKNEKLSIILNLYQIMCFHFIIKQIVTDYSISYNENKKKKFINRNEISNSNFRFLAYKYLRNNLQYKWRTNNFI
jgi:hypothetical protein